MRKYECIIRYVEKLLLISVANKLSSALKFQELFFEIRLRLQIIPGTKFYHKCSLMSLIMFEALVGSFIYIRLNKIRYSLVLKADAFPCGLQCHLETLYGR